MILTLYEPFRHWSENGSVYILSDPHFGDSDCKLMNPGWIEPEEQVARINALVMKNDTFVCLGDVGDPSYVKQIRARKKILLLGNHDKKKDYKGLFNEIYDGPLMISEKILLSHEPVYGLPWCLNIHGHDHSSIEPYKEGCKHLNLAANVCDYTPVSLGKLIKDGILSDITTIHRMTIDQARDFFGGLFLLLVDRILHAILKRTEIKVCIVGCEQDDKENLRYAKMAYIDDAKTIKYTVKQGIFII